MTEFDILYFAPGLPSHGEKACAAAAGDISRRQRRLRLTPGLRIPPLLLALLLAGTVIRQWHAIADWAAVNITPK